MQSPILPERCASADCEANYNLRARHPDELTPVLERGLATPGVVVMEIVVEQEENVFPMIPPGAGINEMVLAPNAKCAPVADPRSNG